MFRRFSRPLPALRNGNGEGTQKAQNRTQEAQEQSAKVISCAFCVLFVPLVFRSRSRWATPPLRAIILFSLALSLSSQAEAETLAKSGRFGGITIRYKVVLPNGYDPAKSYPGVLAFAGGRQNLDAVNNMLDRNWAPEAEQRGYIIVSPIAPSNNLFFERGADGIFPEFLDQILRDYKIENGKLHIAGPSNGGLSAFHIAAMYPQYFRSVTGFPGYLRDESNSKTDALKPLCIYMHVGERDTEWLTPMVRQSELFHEKGLRVRFTIEPDQGQGIQTPYRRWSPSLVRSIRTSNPGLQIGEEQ